MYGLLQSPVGDEPHSPRGPSHDPRPSEVIGIGIPPNPSLGLRVLHWPWVPARPHWPPPSDLPSWPWLASLQTDPGPGPCYTEHPLRPSSSRRASSLRKSAPCCTKASGARGEGKAMSCQPPQGEAQTPRSKPKPHQCGQQTRAWPSPPDLGEPGRPPTRARGESLGPSAQGALTQAFLLCPPALCERGSLGRSGLTHGLQPQPVCGILESKRARGQP